MLNTVGISVPFPGARRPLEEGKKLGLWDFVLLEGESVRIPPAETYIFAAYHPVYDRLLSLRGRIGILWTSSAGEMDMESVEQQYLKHILDDPRISFVWFGDACLARVYPEKGFYAPYPLDTNVPKPDMPKQDIATLFCPTGPKKNILNMLLAMRLVQKEIKLTLQTNVEGYDLGGLDCVKQSWLPSADYRNILAAAKVNLAVSWCETWNYNVAEAALLGTPSVTCKTIPLPGVKVQNPNSPIEIAEMIVFTATHPTIIYELTVAFALKCNQLLLETLKPLDIV